jgi:hypothetical protein
VALFTTLEIFLMCENSHIKKISENKKKIKNKTFSDVALFTTSEMFLMFQIVTRQKIMTYHYSTCQNFDFLTDDFLRCEKGQKWHVRNLFDVPIGLKR